MRGSDERLRTRTSGRAGMDLGGAVVLVSGSSAGIGRATAEALARRGARVVVHGRDRARTAEVARRTGGTAVTADLSAPGGPAELASKAVAAYGGVDAAVLNAGRGWSGPLTDMSPELVAELVVVNQLSALLLARELLPGMLARGAGRLVLVTSVAGHTGVAGEAVYAGTKAALEAFAESMRMELAGSGVGVGVVVPAAVRTDFFKTRGRPYDRGFPPPLRPEAVARAVLAVLESGRDELWVPRWLRVVPVLQALAPRTFRRLSGRFGEQVQPRAASPAAASTGPGAQPRPPREDTP